jgi:hypothetical protein
MLFRSDCNAYNSVIPPDHLDTKLIDQARAMHYSLVQQAHDVYFNILLHPPELRGRNGVRYSDDVHSSLVLLIPPSFQNSVPRVRLDLHFSDCTAMRLRTYASLFRPRWASSRRKSTVLSTAILVRGLLTRPQIRAFRISWRCTNTYSELVVCYYEHCKQLTNFVYPSIRRSMSECQV